ncbi:MAG: ABC transporter substrate-binding protein [Lapillicoccus sp.]
MPVTTRRSFSLCLAGLAVVALGACGSSSLSGGSSSSSSSSSAAAVTVDPALVAKLPAKVKSAGTIVIGTDATYKPNEYLGDDGKTVVGMDVDLFDAVMAKFGIKTQWTPSAFDAIILGVDSSKYDIGVSSFTINKERLGQATMVSYFAAGTQWVTQKGNPKKVDPANACGLNIGAQTGTVQILVDIPARSKKCTDAGQAAINPLVDSDQGKVTTSVLSGKADAMLVDLPPALKAVEDSQGALELLGTQYDSAPYGYVIPKAETDFGQAITEALKALTADGTYTKILTKWGVQGGAITDFAVNPAVTS